MKRHEGRYTLDDTKTIEDFFEYVDKEVERIEREEAEKEKDRLTRLDGEPYTKEEIEVFFKAAMEREA